MKCPECQNQHRAKLGQTCARCGYVFVFNPKSTDTPKMTDGMFLSLVRTASRNGTQYFTGNQLYAVYCRTKPTSRWPKIFGGMIMLGIGVGLCLSTPGIPAFVFTGVGLLFVGLGIFGKDSMMSPEKFEQYVEKFHRSGKPIEKLIHEPQLNQPPPEWPEPDIYDYGVERVLIVERDILVDLFVKNEQHTEQRMLVISQNGYPRYLLPVAKQLLEQRPDLPVFLLHDATARGQAMKDKLLKSEILPVTDHPITDLGMFAEDFQKLKRIQNYDPANESRALPVDALMMPFLIGGLGTAFASGMALRDLLEQHQHAAHTGMSNSSFDFG
jgi:hypothetical protein